MSICHDRKLIFIHIPKNAGTSIHSCFNSPIESILSDETWKEYSSFFKEWNEYTTFTITRNPYCRFKSIYKYLKIGKDINHFAKIVEKKYNQIPIARPQCHYICNDDVVMVDKIIKYENLKEDLLKIGIKDLPLKNQSKKVSEQKLEMNKDTLDIIHNIYEKDFAILNYDIIH